MKARTESENWVQSLRTLIRDSLGTNWQIKPNKGKTKIRIRFDDGSRVEKMLGIDWSKAEAPKILKTVEEIHHLTIKKKVPLDEAVERVKKTRNKALNLAATPNPKRLLNAWKNMRTTKLTSLEMSLKQLGTKSMEENPIMESFHHETNLRGRPI